MLFYEIDFRSLKMPKNLRFDQFESDDTTHEF